MRTCRIPTKDLLRYTRYNITLAFADVTFVLAGYYRLPKLTRRARRVRRKPRNRRPLCQQRRTGVHICVRAHGRWLKTCGYNGSKPRTNAFRGEFLLSAVSEFLDEVTNSTGKLTNRKELEIPCCTVSIVSVQPFVWICTYPKWATTNTHPHRIITHPRFSPFQQSVADPEETTLLDQRRRQEGMFSVSLACSYVSISILCFGVFSFWLS